MEDVRRRKHAVRPWRVAFGKSRQRRHRVEVLGDSTRQAFLGDLLRKHGKARDVGAPK